MSKHRSPNDSLQQSTREPSVMDGRNSLQTSTMTYNNSSLMGGGQKTFNYSGTQIGGGSAQCYLLDFACRLHKEIESTTRKLELEQRRLHGLDKALATANSEFEGKRKKFLINRNPKDDMVAQVEHRTKKLEHRLEKAKSQLNKGQHDNLRLREQIDQLRRERLILDNVFGSLEKEIQENKEHLSEAKKAVIDHKVMAGDAAQRTEGLNKMLERERKEFKNQCEEQRQEMQKVKVLQQMQETLHRSGGGADRSGSALGAAGSGAGKTGRDKKPYMVADEEEAFSEQQMYRRILKLSFLNTIQRRHIKQYQKNIEVYEQAFSTIKTSTGYTDIEEIVQIFMTLEQRNFSLLTYVNQLNREIESIEIRNRELESQKQEHELQHDHDSSRKDEVLEEVRMQIKKTQEASDQKEREIQEAHNALANCRPEVWKIVEFLTQQLPTLIQSGYEGDAPNMKALSEPPDKHEENLNNYLMYIEKAILEFRVCLEQNKLWSQHVSHPPAKPNRVGGAARPNDPKPSDLPVMHVDGDSDEEEEQLGNRPLTRGELRKKALNNVNKIGKGRQGRQQAGGHGGKSQGETDGDVGEASRKAEPTSKDGLASKSPSVLAKDAFPKQPSDSTPEDIKEEEDGDNRKDHWWRGQGKENPKRAAARS